MFSIARPSLFFASDPFFVVLFSVILFAIHSLVKNFSQNKNNFRPAIFIFPCKSKHPYFFSSCPINRRILFECTIHNQIGLRFLIIDNRWWILGPIPNTYWAVSSNLPVCMCVQRRLKTACTSKMWSKSWFSAWRKNWALRNPHSTHERLWSDWSESSMDAHANL